MAYPTKKDIDRINAGCYARLLSELLEFYDSVKDIYFSDCGGEWVLQFNDGRADEQFDTFLEITNYLQNVQL